MGQRGLWNIAKKRMSEDRGALPDKAMHEDMFSQWVRDDTEGEAEDVEEMRKDQRRRH